MPKIPLCDEKSKQVSRDYDTFCAEWEDHIKTFVLRSNLFYLNDIDDVVQDLMEAFYSKDYLEKYDSDKSTFSTSVYNFISIRIRGMRDRRIRHSKRECLSLNTTLRTYDSGSADKHPDNIDMLESIPDDISFEFIDMVKSVYKELVKTPVQSTINDYPKLFSCIVQQIVYGISEECIAALGEKAAKRTGRFCINRKALAYEMGVNTGTVSLMLTRFATLPIVVELLGPS